MIIGPGLPIIVPISQILSPRSPLPKAISLVDPAGQKPNTLNPDLVK